VRSGSPNLRAITSQARRNSAAHDASDGGRESRCDSSSSCANRSTECRAKCRERD